jgi:hypothetical protein
MLVSYMLLIFRELIYEAALKLRSGVSFYSYVLNQGY